MDERDPNSCLSSTNKLFIVSVWRHLDLLFVNESATVSKLSLKRRYGLLKASVFTVDILQAER